MDLSLYLVTQRYDFSDETFLTIIEKACQNGVTLVQLREKELTTRAFYQLAIKVKAVTDRYQIPLIINDRVDICLAVDAAGVHIGDDELSVAMTRQLIGSDKILGVSTKTVAAGLHAKAAGADYLGVGAMYPTQTKDSSLVTKKELRAIYEATSLPIVAIGGISSENAALMMSLPVEGIAVVSEIMKAEDVSTKVQELKQLVLHQKERLQHD